MRKYPQRAGGQLKYKRLKGNDSDDEIAALLEAWGKGREFHDPDTFIRFCFCGDHCWGLFRDGELVGLNVGDENHAYAIYRCCIDDGTPYLNEYLRHLFYLSPWVQTRRWVNDGGDLGQEGLRRFKMKLNPVAVQTVYSYNSR